MPKILFTFLILFLTKTLAQTTGTNTQIHAQEAVERQKAADRQESANTSNALKPNEKSAPTKVDTSTWGLDPNVRFEVTNHLLGYSTISESEQSLSGIKLTGLINFAYYNVKRNSNTSNERSKARYVFGFESPIQDLTQRITLWGGGGFTMGDARGLYLDLGLDLRIFSWFKIQGGMNYNSVGSISPQLSIGLVW
jgi:hypothetical protein